jgi:hypothetical protein
LNGNRVVTQAGDSTRVWDIKAEQCIRDIEGLVDITTAGEDIEVLAWRTTDGEEDVAIETTGLSTCAAWFPTPLDHVASHGKTRVWAGASGDRLYIIALEGARMP